MTLVHTGPIESSPDMALVAADPASRAVGVTDAMSLLRFAVERGLPVAELRELIALANEQETRAAAREFAQAVAAFQAEVPQIKKSTTAKIATRGGGNYSYTYAELDEIVATIRPFAVKHGLSWTFNSRVDQGSLTADCIVRHIRGHSETSSFTLPVANESAMSAQQKVGAALTYAKRQALVAAFGLVTTDEDTDAVETSNPTPITLDQAVEIDDLLAETKADKARFLAFVGAATVGEIRAVDYQRAISALKRKAAK